MNHANNFFFTFEDFVSSGVEYAETDRIGKRVLLANQISLVTLLLGIPVLILYVAQIKEYPMLIVSIPWVLLYSGIPFLNRLGYINFTRIAMCIAFPLSFFILPLISKLYFKEEAIGINMYYVPRIAMLVSFCLPLLLIEMKERFFMYLSVGLTLVLLVSFDWVDNWLGVGIEQVTIHYRFYPNLKFYSFLAAIFLISVFFYLGRANQLYELDILSLNKTLDNRVRQKTRELVDANNDLKAFSYTVSHELKTALMAAKMLAQSIKAAPSDKENDLEANQQKLKVMRGCLNEMQQLIDDIMAYSQVGLKTGASECINMSALSKEVVQELSAKYDASNVKWDIAPLPAIPGDPKMIKVVMTNLISNALKFSRDQDQPVIHLWGKRENDHAVFHVEDNGVGFDMKKKEKLFEIFERLHSKSKYEGTGLGLAISKRIIERHGGEIWAEGKPGKGAVFSFQLPGKE